MTKELAIRIITGDVLGTSEQTQEAVTMAVKALLMPPAQPEIIHCKYCIYYDPEHVEKDGVRYEYSDMPKDAFDILGTNLVNSKYGVNVGGRCCRDYNVGYPEDKRVFVSEQNFCGRAERKQDADND